MVILITVKKKMKYFLLICLNACNYDVYDNKKLGDLDTLKYISDGQGADPKSSIKIYVWNNEF